MKQLRAEGIKKLIEAQRQDVVHLLRLSREDKELQDYLTVCLGPLELAEARMATIIDNHRERIDA
jgi:hypothetical protein